MTGPLATISKLLEPLARRIKLITARGTVTLVDDEGEHQRVQVDLLAGERARWLERFQSYGFYSYPPNGSEICAVFLGGDRGHGIALQVDTRGDRPHLEAGEVAVATNGAIIKIRVDGTVEISSPTRVIVDAPELACTGDIRDRRGTMEAMRTIYDSHVHIENDAHGPTDPTLERMGDPL